MKISSRLGTLLSIASTVTLLLQGIAWAEVADSVYRDMVLPVLGDVGHAALTYQYDNATQTKKVIQMFGGASGAPNNCEVGSWADFLGGQTYWGSDCPAQLSKSVRDSIISDALDQLNAHYWQYPVGHWEVPNSSPGAGDGYFRCDSLVEWCYRQNGYELCNDTLLYVDGPIYQWESVPDAIETPPYNVTMTYPSSQNPNSPTVSSTANITLQATGADTESGLAYNQPFTYWYATYINGSWTSWTELGTGDSSKPVQILSANTVYAWYVDVYDNSGNSTASSVYYFEYVPQYPISTSSSPSNGGTTSGGGTYNSGSTATVCASPNSCYTFANWTENGSVVSSSSCYSFTVSGNRSLVANFNPINYSISTSSSPSGGGTASGGGAKTCGSSVTVCATPNTCYQFVSWTENGQVVSTSPCYTFTVSGNRNLVANFALITCTISVSSSPPVCGLPTGSGIVTCGSGVTVCAPQCPCYVFVNWTEDGNAVSTSPCYAFTVTGNRTLVANFSQIIYTINTSSSPSSGGTTSGGGPKGCGTSVTVVATPSACYQFVNWTENGSVVSTSPSYTFIASGSRNLVANFSPINVTISTSSSPSGGGVTSGGGTVTCGSSVTVCATPNTGYGFVNWTENGSTVSASSCYSFTASGNGSLVANFTCAYAISPTTVSVGSGGGSGSVGVTAGSGCSWTATSNAGWINIPSGGSGTGNGTVAYNILSNSDCVSRTGTVTVAGQTFTVIEAGGSGSFSISPANVSVGSGGGSGSVGVTAGSGCNWTATSNVGWITIANNGSGTGNGTVNYSVAANTGNCASRIGTMTIAGKTYTVTEDADAGSFGVNPTSASAPANGGLGTIAVTASAGNCSWTASSGVGWITISSGSSGMGNGSVNYTVAANTSNCIQRTGNLTVAGNTFTLTQAAGTGSYSISPTSVSYGRNGGSGSIVVNAGDGCTWVANSPVDWVQITSEGAGTGAGSVTYSVNDNPVCDGRSTNLTVAGQTFSVSQISRPPVITSPPVVTNALGTVGDISVVKLDKAVTFLVGTNDPDGDTLSFQWGFDDGGSSTNCSPTHVFTNCGPYDVSVTISDSCASVTSGMTVAVSCPMDIANLKLKANFKRLGLDGCTVKGTLPDLPAGFSVTNALVALDVGDTIVDFELNKKGQGVNSNGNFKLSYSKKTGIWSFTGTLKGNLKAPWANYGVTGGSAINTDVSFPVLLLLQSGTLEAFDGEVALTYSTNRSGTSGSGTYRRVK